MKTKANNIDTTVSNSSANVGLDLFALKKSIKEKQLAKSLKLTVNK